MTIPCIGWLTALSLVSVIGDITRFPSPRHLVGYLGLDPRVRQSGEREIWENGPGRDPAPRLTKLRGAGPVPVWFVSWPQLQAAAADGVLTIAELRALPSLITGVASRFRETLHPSQSNKKAKLNIGARGTLSDGRTFKFQFVAHDADVKHVAIRFR